MKMILKVKVNIWILAHNETNLDECELSLKMTDLNDNLISWDRIIKRSFKLCSKKHIGLFRIFHEVIC